ncbi:26S proteasome non-ATPase regulatory subunit 4, partial [Corapipo altera]|uniref:26S proteasome non-ATPase regulatory subunit 4 n=1 Tax=Corapipo altera TaxID=415028 RepID=UPI000FD6815E
MDAPHQWRSALLAGVGGAGRRRGAKMVLESTMVCVDNSEYMRNGDFLPTRLQAQQDAVNIVCHSKTRSNPENNVGLITLANNCEVLTTLTPDTGRILSKLHTVQPKGKITFCTGIRVAHLALKHRQGKNHKMRIIAFVGSPVEDNEKDVSDPTFRVGLGVPGTKIPASHPSQEALGGLDPRAGSQGWIPGLDPR